MKKYQIIICLFLLISAAGCNSNAETEMNIQKESENIIKNEAVNDNDKTPDIYKQKITDGKNATVKSTSTVMTAEQAQTKEELKVTFVELGSVKCIPCKMMQPVMDEIEKEYAGQVKVVFYDVWTPEGRPYAEQYGIQGIPTQVFLDKDGKEFHRHMGYYPKEEIEKVLKIQGVK